MPELIGLGRAREMVLTGRRVGGGEALAWGLCERLVDVDGDATGLGFGGVTGERRTDVPVKGDEGVDGKEVGKTGKAIARQKTLNAGIELAMEICEGGPVAIRKAVEALEGWRRGEGREGESENRAYEGVVRTEDRNEALRAFGERRRPVFKGR